MIPVSKNPYQGASDTLARLHLYDNEGKAQISCTRCTRLCVDGLKIVTPFSRRGREVLCEMCDVRHLLSELTKR